MSDHESASGWRRLAPISIGYFTLSNIIHLVKQYIVAIPALAYGVSVADIQASPLFVPAVLTFIFLMAVSGVVNYWFYHYRIRHDHVEIRSGVLKRRHINLPFWRIQNVRIERPFYYRPTRFSVVILDTAGSAQEEAKIVAIDKDQASQLRQQVLAKTDRHSSTSSDVDVESSTARDSVDNEEVINRRSIGDLIVHGLTNNRVWILLGVMAPFYDDLSGPLYRQLKGWGVSPEQLFSNEQVLWWQVGLYVASIFVVVLFVMAMVSVAGSVLVYYGYTLSKSVDRYIRRSGLLSQQEVSMRQSRVQMIAIKQDWLDYLLKRTNLFIEQNRSGPEHGQELNATNKLVVPSVTVDEAVSLTTEIMPNNALKNVTFTPINRRFLFRYNILVVLPLSFVMLAVGLVQEGLFSLFFTLPLTAFLSLIVYLRWRRWGYHVDEHYIYVRRGCLGIDRYVFAQFKLQQVTLVQSVLMKRYGLVNLQFVLASGEITLPFLPVDEATAIANKSLYIVEHSRRSWM